MKSKFATDPLDASDGFFSPDAAGVNSNFLPAPRDSVGNSPANGPQLLPVAALSNEAIVAASSQTGPTSTVTVGSGGITFNLIFDAAATAAPASFQAGIEQAASILAATISDKITVNIDIDYSGTGGGASAGPAGGQYVSYSTVKADLTNAATPGDSTFAALPTGSTIEGQSNIAVWDAELKLFGLLPANNGGVDGSATFATDINTNLLVGVALHELTHAMGRVPEGPPYSSSPDIFDLFRFTSPGTMLIAGGNTAPAAYFSVNGGNTKLADFGQTSDPSDFLNSGVQGPNDPFNEFYTGSTSQNLTTVDKEMLDALGFHTMPPVTTTVIESFGSTSLVQVGNNYYLYANGTSSGPELKYQGAPITVGEWAGWAPIGAEATATGYEVAWKLAGADQYTVWNTDTNGNDTTNTIGTVSGSITALESLETSFHQDLNGDGVIGIPATTTTTIESFGSTSLVQVGNNYYLYANGTSSGPELKYQGAPITVGEWAGWAPIGAEATATGYEVAWKLAGADQYTVWNTDTNGNDTTNTIGTVSGSSTALESLETSFHQDLNGDGVIGIPAATTIESFGSTSLVQVGNNYYLYANGTSSGPELKYQGAPITVGEWAGWAPIGAEATATGYEVAWKLAGADQYTVWNTDTNGNDTTNTIGTVSGSSTALESLEPSFHQDLNGDGVIGIPAATGTAASTPAAQAPPVTVVNNDTFVFRSGLGAGATANAGSTDTTGHDGFAWVAGNAPAAALPDAQAGMPHPVFQWAAGDPFHHDGAPAMNFHPIDPHAGGFIIG